VPDRRGKNNNSVKFKFIYVNIDFPSPVISYNQPIHAMKQELYKYQITGRGKIHRETAGFGELSSLKELMPKTIFDYLVELKSKGQLTQIKLIHEDCICLIEKLSTRKPGPLVKKMNY